MIKKFDAMNWTKGEIDRDGDADAWIGVENAPFEGASCRTIEFEWAERWSHFPETEVSAFTLHFVGYLLLLSIIMWIVMGNIWF